MKKEGLYYLRVLWNLVLVWIIYTACRLIFIWQNPELISSPAGSAPWWRLMEGGMLFDCSALLYTNAIYGLLVLLPLPLRYKNWWQSICKWLFVIVNAVAIAINLIDVVYSRYSGRRTTSSFFDEFSGGLHVGEIVGAELLAHWYLLCIGIALIAILVFFYRRPNQHLSTPCLSHLLIGGIPLYILFILLSIIGMRGGATYHRPISTADASRFVQQPQEVNIVLNTPFSMIRTLGKAKFQVPDYFSDETEAQRESGYSVIHKSSDQATPYNIVILIVESFGREYFGCLNKDMDNGRYEGYTPFLDSLASQSLTFVQAFANGRKSIDALPSIVSSIPMFVEPYVLTRYATNKVESIASLLGFQGYHSAFFHGADNGSMGFEAFTKAVGFQHYYGMNEYCTDGRFNGMDDFDGYWAIWDEEFMQYFALQMSEIEEPFITTLFTASSHHPFHIPARYEGRIPHEQHPMFRCVRYTDYALQQFFATAKQQPWYPNTLFVITADHTNESAHAQYQTSLGLFRIPLLIYDPSGRLPKGYSQQVAQQIDILPTLLHIVGYSQPYIAFGKDLLDSTTTSNWAVNYSNGVYQYVEGSRVLLFDGDKGCTCYDYLADPLLQHPLPKKEKDISSIQHLKAIIYSYMQRMVENNLAYEKTTQK